MAKRLRYSSAGFERALLMANFSIIAIVEGIEDIYFYEQLLAAYTSSRRRVITIQVRTPREVHGIADGKPALLAIFGRLRANKHLSSGGKNIVFFADKDYDDITRKKLRNAHLIYTPGVSMENSLYEAGHVKESVEAVIGRRLPDSYSVLDNFSSWKVSCAKQWQEWIIYCLLCEISAVAPRQNRSGPSRVHAGNPPVLLPDRFRELMSEVSIAIGDQERFSKYVELASKIAENAIKQQETDRVFCGKWYSSFLKDEVIGLGDPYAALSGRISRKALLGHLARMMKVGERSLSFFFQKLDAVTA